MSRVALVATLAAVAMATTVDASGGDDECMNRDMTNEEMDAHIANEPEFGPLKDAGACSLVGGAVAGGFSCHDSFLDSATIQLLSEGVEGNLCMFCAGACATAGDYCCGTPPAPVYYADKTVNDCTCKDTFVYEGVTYDTCTDVDSEGAPWCEVTDDCVDGYDSYVGMGTFDYCIETDAPSSPPPSPYTGCQDVDEATLGEEWSPIIETYGTACSLVRVLGGMDDGALTCDTELADSPSMQSAAPGVSGTLQEVCPRSCGCPEEEEDDDCVDDTSVAGPEWAPIIAMGGCNMLPTMLSLGLTCDSDLGENAVVQGLAPGVSGGVRQFCGASCGGCVEEEEACVDDTSVAGPEWAPIIAMGGCKLMLPTMLSLGLTCDSDLAENAVVQGLAPGVSGGVRQFCGASCGGCVEEEEDSGTDRSAMTLFTGLSQACVADCSYDGTGGPKCKKNQEEYGVACSVNTDCVDFLAGITDGENQNMADSGLTTASEMDQYETYLNYRCGGNGGGDSSDFFFQFYVSCPRDCHSGDSGFDRDGLSKCSKKQTEWGDACKQSHTCVDFIGSLNDADVQAMSNSVGVPVDDVWHLLGMVDQSCIPDDEGLSPATQKLMKMCPRDCTDSKAEVKMLGMNKCTKKQNEWGVACRMDRTCADYLDGMSKKMMKTLAKDNGVSAKEMKFLLGDLEDTCQPFTKKELKEANKAAKKSKGKKNKKSKKSKKSKKNKK